MAYHSAISSLALAVLLILSIPGARAFDESRYPNWKGQWVEGGVVRTSAWDTSLPAGAGEQAFLTPEYQAVFSANVKDEADGGPPADPTSRCVPAGMPRVMMAVQPMEIVITPGMTYFMFAALDSLRRIYTDGRSFPTDIEPSFRSDSGRTPMVTDASIRSSSRPAPSGGPTPTMRAAFRSTRTARRLSPRRSTGTRPIRTFCTTRSPPAIMR